MIKRVIAILCVVGILQAVVIGGCGPCTPKIYSSQLTGVVATCENFQQVLQDSSPVEVDSFRIKCVLHGSTNQRPKYAFHQSFISTAMATTNCEHEDVNEGLTVKVVDIELRCNQKLWNTESGKPLDTVHFSLQKNFYAYGANVGREAYIQRLNVQGGAFREDGIGYGESIFYLKFKEEFDTKEPLKFTATLTLEDGTELNGETGFVRAK